VVAARIGFRRVAPVGMVLTGVAFVILSQLQADSSYWHFLAGLLVFGVGMGLAGTPATTAITASLPFDKQGVASAVNDTGREVGSALGIAILGSLLNQGYRDGMADAVAGLPDQVAEGVLSSIAFTASPLVALMGDTGKQLVQQAIDAFVSGVGQAVLVGSIILIVAAVAVAIIAPSGMSQATVMSDSDDEGASESDPLSSLRDG